MLRADQTVNILLGFLLSYLMLSMLFIGPNRHQLLAEDALLPAELPLKPLLLYHPKVCV